MTEHLGLHLTGLAELVSTDLALNQNWEKLDALGLMYPVQSGTSGDWDYVVYSNGVAMCWVDDKLFSTQSVNKPWGSLFTTDTMSFGSYPITFGSSPFVQVVFKGSDESGRYSYVAQQSSYSQSRTPDFRLVDPLASTLANPHFGLFAIGKVPVDSVNSGA